MNARKVLAFSVGPVVGGAMGLLTLPVLTWFFSPEDIGRLSMLQVSVSFSILFFSLGLDQAYVREFHEVQDKPALLKAVVVPGSVILVLTLFCLALSPLSLSLLLFDIDSLLLSTLLYAAVLLSFGSRFFSLILRMQERGFAFSMSQILPKFIFLSIVLGYVWFGADSVFYNLIMANFLSLLAVFLVHSWNTRKEWLQALNATIDKSKQLQMIRYAIPLIGSGVAFWGLTTMDKVFLRSLSSFEELGVYSVAVSFAGAALVFQAIFSTVWAPLIYKWDVEGASELKIINLIDYIVFVVVFIWTLSGMFSWVVLYFLPQGFVQVQYIMLAAMAYPLLYTLSEVTGVGIGIKRKTMYSMLAAFSALIFNALGNWILIPICDAKGAVISSAIAFLIFFTIRTEVSSSLWLTFNRFKIYTLIFLLVFVSVLFNVIYSSSIIVFACYFSILLLALFFFNNQVTTILKFIFSRILNFIYSGKI